MIPMQMADKYAVNPIEGNPELMQGPGGGYAAIYQKRISIAAEERIIVIVFGCESAARSQHSHGDVHGFTPNCSKINVT
ncbi:hypothetical protein D3C73_1458970 [compost metagenome]